MAERRAGTVLRGVPAASGLALGPCARLVPSIAARVAGGDAKHEAAALSDALKRAGDELHALIANEDKLAADILEFQALLLQDPDLIGQVRSRIEAKAPADAAWREVLDNEIANYASAEDEYMSARANDLVDLRDRVLRALAGGGYVPPEVAHGSVLVAGDLTPSAFLELDWARLSGAALGAGSSTSHVSLLARSRGVPMVVGLGELDAVEEGETVGLDGDAGTLVVAPPNETVECLRRRINLQQDEREKQAVAALMPALTKDGRRIRVLVNVDDPALLSRTDVRICDGVGLTRTEFLFADGAPDEDRQTQVYEHIIRWAEGRPVTIRTLDAGGDKPIPGLTIDEERNPFLGVRGVRLSLRDPEVFKVQLKAIARAARIGPVKIMIPMVTAPAELSQVEMHLESALDDLEARGLPHARPPLGIMVETPAAALTAADWNADFYSIGSNDLIQYVTACARDSRQLSMLANPTNPAVLELIGRTIRAGCERNVEVSLCGDMASSPELVPVLLQLGLDTFSVAPAQVGAVKLAISRTCRDEANYG